MTTSGPFKEFADALEQRLGTPKSLSDEDIQNDLKSIHGNVFAGFDQINRILKYQDPAMNLGYKFVSVERYKRSSDCALNFTTSNGQFKFAVKFTPTSILTNEPSFTGGQAAYKEWPKEDGMEFVNLLTKLILSVA